MSGLSVRLRIQTREIELKNGAQRKGRKIFAGATTYPEIPKQCTHILEHFRPPNLSAPKTGSILLLLAPYTMHARWFFVLLCSTYVTKSWTFVLAGLTLRQVRFLHDLASSTITEEPAVAPSTTVERRLMMPTYLSRFGANISLDNPFGEMVTSKELAKEQLMSLLSAAKNDQSFDVHLRLEYLSQVLQQYHIPIQTIPFLDLVNRGTWLKAYSSVLRVRESPNIKYNITQIIAGETPGMGTIMENVQWIYSLPGDVRHMGCLQVRSEYNYTSRGHTLHHLQEHLLLPETMPEDVETFLAELQRSIPFETFDPNGIVAEILVRECSHTCI